MSNIPLDTRFIGIAPEVNLYERKTNLLNAQTQPYTMQDIIDTAGGGGGGVTSVTKAQFDTLVSTNGLTPGAYYIISGVDTTLYGGTTIIMQAETTNKLALAGHGIFYNPKYLNSQLTPSNGYGIWSNYMYPTFSNIVGVFTKGDIVTANNGATATYLVEGFLSWISGDWSAATSITDNSSGATANIVGAVSPSYAIGSDVIWGGKHWTNTSGNVGTAVNKYTLSGADWTAVAFNDVDYNVSIDLIHYDYSHDMIVRRKDKWDNDVDGNYESFYLSTVYFSSSPIKAFQWGNGPEDFNNTTLIGVIGNYVKDSYLECINFIGSQISYNILTQVTYFDNNITDKLSSFTNNTINGGSWSNDRYYSGISGSVLANTDFSGNIIDTEAYLYDNHISNGYFRNNIIKQLSVMGNNIIIGSELSYNILTYNSQINYNKLRDNSSIKGNILNTDCEIDDNTLNSYCLIGKNELSSDASISYNNMTNSVYISYNNIIQQSSINSNTIVSSTFSYNNLSTNSGIEYSSFSNDTIQFNEIKNSSIGGYQVNSCTVSSNNLNNSYLNLASGTTTLSTKTLRYLTMNYGSTNGFDLSTATIIYGNYTKEIFKRQDSTSRLGYYNNSDVFTVVNVNA